MKNIEKVGQLRAELIKSIKSVMSKKKVVKLDKEIDSSVFGDDWYASFRILEISETTANGIVEEFDDSKEESIPFEALDIEALANILDAISQMN